LSLVVRWSVIIVSDRFKPQSNLSLVSADTRLF